MWYMHKMANLFFNVFSIFLFFLHPIVEGQDICQQTPIDVVFLLDGSRSVRPHNFQTIKNYVKNFTYMFEEIGPTGAQIGVVQFASTVREEIRLNEFADRWNLLQAIENIEYMNKGTMTGEALKFLVTTSLTPSHGSRMGQPNVHTVALVITDGKSQDYHRNTLTKYQKEAKDLGVELFGIGIGKKTNEDELLEIASEPKEDHKFHTDDFDGIRTISLSLQHLRICDEDECQRENGGCDHMCNNTIGSYECSCEIGYQLQEDRRSCQVMDLPSPTNLQTTEISHTTAQIQWDFSEEFDERFIHHYVIRCTRVDGIGEEKVIEIFDGKSCTILDLEPSTEYIASVSAISTSLSSSPSTQTVFNTESLGRTTVSLNNPTLTTLNVQWTPAGGDGLTGYEILLQKVDDLNGAYNSATSANKVIVIQSLADADEMTVEGLEPGSLYSFEVIPLHGKLQGVMGSAQLSTEALPKVQAVVSNSSLCQLNVEWENLPYQVDSWNVSIFEENGNVVNGRTLPGNQLSTSFQNLRPSTPYNVKVSATVTENGQKFITPLTNITGITESLEAPSVSIAGRTPSSLTVEWLDISFKATSWTVKVFPKGQKRRFKLKQVDSSVNSVVMDDLLPSTLYKVEVFGHVTEGRSVLLSPKGKIKARTRPLTAPVVKCKDVSESTLKGFWKKINAQMDSWTIRVFAEGRENETEVFQQDGSELERRFLELESATLYIIEVVGNKQTEGYDQQSSPVGNASCMTNPAEPMNLEVIGRGVNDLTIAFDAPPGLFESYDGECIPQNDRSAHPVKATFISDSVMQCDGLDPGTSYDVRVVSVYRNQSSSFSTASTVTLIPPPRTLLLKQATTHSLRAEWEAPIFGEVDFYYVTYNSSEEDIEMRIVNGGQTTVLLDDLDPNTKYWVKVQAEINDELGDPATASLSTIPDVLNLKINKIGYTSINVSWTPSSVPHLSSYCLKYTPTYLLQSQYQNDVELSTDTLSYFITELETATTYSIGLNGKYARRQSEEVEVNATTLAQPPLRPITFSNVTDTSFVAHWLPPESRPLAVNYVVTYFTDTGTNITMEDISTTYILVEDLDPAKTYNISVSACYPEDLVSHPILAHTTTLPADSSSCSCSAYLQTQSQMQSAMMKMMQQIDVLTNKIDELKLSHSRNARSKSKKRRRKQKDRDAL